MASDARIAEARANSFSLLTSRPDHWLNTTVTSASSMSSDASMGPHSLNSWIFNTFCPESFAISNSAAPTLICLSVCQMTSLLLPSTKATPAKTTPLRRIRGGVVGHGLLAVGGVVGAAILAKNGCVAMRSDVHINKTCCVSSIYKHIESQALRPAAARTGARCRGQSKEPADSV